MLHSDLMYPSGAKLIQPRHSSDVLHARYLVSVDRLDVLNVLQPHRHGLNVLNILDPGLAGDRWQAWDPADRRVRS